MAATEPRYRFGRPRQEIVCGRKQCHGCKHFRHVMDFAVDRWEDEEKTRPLTFRPRCRTCSGRAQRKRYFSQSLEERTKADRAKRDRLNPDRRRHRQRVDHDDAARVEQRSVNRVLRKMSRANRILYEMEGTLPLVESIASEDHDPTPVPTGCSSCYLHGGNTCITCPDPDVKARQREARKQGRIVGTPLRFFESLAS